MSLDISVVVPVYNVERYLDKCIQSLINQDFDSYEIILIDDGSTDKSPYICDGYEKNSKRIRTIHKANGGLGDARNYGVKNSFGKYVTFVDSDDYVEKKYLSNLWKLISTYSADICITRIKRANENQDVVPHDCGETYCLEKREAICSMYSHQGFGWSACGKLFKRELLIEHPFPSGYYEDCAVMYRILDDCEKIAVGDYLYNYHYINHEGSILQSRLSDKHYRIFEICEEFDCFINKEYRDLYFLTLLLKRSAITQMLSCQRMEWGEYNSIFMKYRSLFRRHIRTILSNKNISSTNKIMHLLYCTNPIVIRILNLRKRK